MESEKKRANQALTQPKVKKHKLTPKMEQMKWKKGQSGNPKGGPLMNPIQRALKELTVKTYADVIEMVLTGNLDELRRLIDDPKSAAVQVGIARSFLNAIEAGDYSVIERIAERIVGKIPEQVLVRARSLNMSVDAQTKETSLKAAIASVESEF